MLQNTKRRHNQIEFFAKAWMRKISIKDLNITKTLFNRRLVKNR